MENQKKKVWFITGAPRGFGRIWAGAALEHGDQVAVTARKLDSIVGLNEKYGANVLTLELDVTNSDQVKTVINKAFDHFGRLDVVINNADYSLVGTIEEASSDEVKAMYDTNIFGALSVLSRPFCRSCGSKEAGTSSAHRVALAM